MDSHILLYLVPIFFLIALLYSMIGQGGGSAYLAALALTNIQYQNIPPAALACNIAVTVSTVYHFVKEGHLKYRLIVPFLITSIPAAFIGGTISIPEKIFKFLLIIILVLISLRTFFWKEGNKNVILPSIKTAYIWGPVIGLILGLISGIIGIGGGILLLPAILLLGWGDAKQGAVAGGIFTLINSVSALLGHGVKGIIDINLMVPLLIAVVIGGQIGSRLGARKLSAQTVQKVFAVILFGVAIRLAINIL